MKRLIILVVLTLLFAGCGKDEKTSQHSNLTKDSATQPIQSISDDPALGKKRIDGNISEGIKNLVYEPGKLPDNVRFSGTIVASARWEDKNGENIIIITETPLKKQKDDLRMKELFGYQYTIYGGETKLLWKINDFVNNCPVDLTLKYIENSLSITDLDNNGIAESSFLYRMSCKGDVSPDDIKLLMHEGDTKYAIRGQMELTIKGEGTYGGETKVDPSFNSAPKEFFDYAKDRWSKFRKETIGN